MYIVCLCACVCTCVCLHTMHKRNTQAVKSQFYIHYNESSTTRNNNSDRNSKNNNNKNNNLRLKASRSSFFMAQPGSPYRKRFHAHQYKQTHKHTYRPSHIDSHPHPHPPTHTLAKAVSKTNGIGGVRKERRNKRN